MPRARCPFCGLRFQLRVAGDAPVWDEAAADVDGEEKLVTCFGCARELRPEDVVEVIRIPSGVCGAAIGDIGTVVGVTGQGNARRTFEVRSVMADSPGKWSGNFERHHLRYGVPSGKVPAEHVAVPSPIPPPVSNSPDAGWEWLPKHFRAYRRLEPWPFCWRITLEGLLVSIFAAIILTVFLNQPRRTDMDDLDTGGLFTVLVVVAPLVETLLFQAFPIFIGRCLRFTFAAQIFISTLLFSAAHFPSGVATGVSAGIVGGFYFSFTYAHWRETSRSRAYWVTALSHALHNLFVFLVIVIPKGL